MEDLSLHILDIMENSVNASAKEIILMIDEDTAADRMTLVLQDDGDGMDEAMCKQALDPFFTTRTTRRVGLGLPLLAQAAKEAGGNLTLESEPGKGTTVRAVFQLNHPDLKPLGDVPATLVAIASGRPQVDIFFEYRRDGEVVAHMDSRRFSNEESE